MLQSSAAVRHLLIDPNAVEMQTEGVEISLGNVVKDDTILLSEDRPWEAAWWNTYPTVAYDAKEKLYKMWYNGNTDCGPAGGRHKMGMCPHLKYNYSLKLVQGKKSNGATMYAESKAANGPWTKPDLGLIEWNGTKHNNIVLQTPTDPNRGVFLDSNPTSDPAQRFKMFGVIGAGVHTMTSADGRDFPASSLKSATSMDVAADTANNALYDPDLDQYIAFSRNHCTNQKCNETGWGERRETRSVSKTWGGGWEKATDVLHGEHGYVSRSMQQHAAGELCAALDLFLPGSHASAGDRRRCTPLSHSASRPGPRGSTSPSAPSSPPPIRRAMCIASSAAV
jgi:hypothetical protein